ncbi:MAG: CinA family protein [Oscillospiraceae bacterium]|nr:CinA family protein [Oscillospiraceae bacterium]
MTLEEMTVEALKRKNLVMACAESCTGGLIAKRITDISGSSAVFNCGIVSYSNGIKEKLLGVREETLRKFGAVSEQTVREMVSGVLSASGADVAVAVSGIAGPLSDNTDKPVGLIYIAVSDGEETRVKRLNNIFDTDIRNCNRISASDEALKMILEIVGD